MLNSYLNQFAELKSFAGLNTYGEASFNEVKEIKCRIVNKFKQITNEKGNVVISSGIIQCIEPVKIGDLINDRKVISVSHMTGLDGVIGYKGYLQ